MINEEIIKDKYKEYYEKYSRQNIDDYDNYVMSRTIEYFYNTERFSADKLVDFITYSVKESNPCPQCEPERDKGFGHTQTDGPEAGPASRTGPRKKEKRQRRKKHGKKPLCLVLICAVIFFGCRKFKFGRKK